MIAYHGDPKVKELALAWLRGLSRREIEYRFVVSILGVRFADFGIPKDLAALLMYVYNDLSSAVGRQWPLTVLSAIPVGAELDGIAQVVWERIADLIVSVLLEAPLPEGIKEPKGAEA